MSFERGSWSATSGEHSSNEGDLIATAKLAMKTSEPTTHAVISGFCKSSLENLHGRHEHLVARF